MQTFVDDDEGYLAWVDQHLEGFIVNTYRDPSRSYLVLHRSTCGTVSGTPTHGKNWTTGYAKVCSESISELDDWAEKRFELTRIVGCRSCVPRTNDPPMWPLEAGDSLQRTDLHRLVASVYGGGGGQRQGGISTPAEAPEILFFTDPLTGVRHGYVDEWRSDGCFHYTGEGQRGDQLMLAGNSAIANHLGAGKRLRKFNGSSGKVSYAGEFAITDDPPFYETDAPESGGGGAIRKVIVFRLRPIGHSGPTPTRSGDRAADSVRRVAVEQQHTESYVQVTQEASREVARIEQSLVRAYMDMLIADGHEVSRHEYHPDQLGKPIYSDLFDETTGTLIEAKGSVSRESIRMAIGQLADYSRYENSEVSRAVLLPEPPRQDLEELLLSLGVAIIFRAVDTFAIVTGD